MTLADVMAIAGAVCAVVSLLVTCYFCLAILADRN
jgi:hypothetical protein